MVEPTKFEEAAEEKAMSLPQEFWLFLKENKKWWLLPIVIVLAGIAILSVFASGSAAPFIYTIF
ncbi:MAG: hypothetical protein HQ567_02655 [Candidatus Nealsonbacteria bacterium]|nr:hypothetical protein [Candidatus Nealsonbacteria bacterium]